MATVAPLGGLAFLKRGHTTEWEPLFRIYPNHWSSLSRKTHKFDPRPGVLKC